MFWNYAILILFLTGLAMMAAASLRNALLQQKFRLDLSNKGNVQSRYRISAEDASFGLEFQFVVGGKPVELRFGDGQKMDSPTGETQRRSKSYWGTSQKNRQNQASN